MHVVISGARPSPHTEQAASLVAAELQRQLALAGHTAVYAALSVADFEPDFVDGKADMHLARAPSSLVNALEGADELVHVPFVGDDGGPDAWLDACGRQTYNLLLAAAQAGVKRATLLTTMESFLAYPANAAVSPAWAPRPSVAPSSLAPHLGEFVAKQFARAAIGGLSVLIARLGELEPGAHFHTTSADAAATILNALASNVPVPRWSVLHIHELLTSTDPNPPAIVPAAQRPHPSSTPPSATRVLLLGARGFLGPHLITSLENAGGYEILATDVPGGQLSDEPNTTVKWRELVLQKYGNNDRTVLPLDITDTAAVASAAASVDVVVNCAVTRYSPVATWRVNAVGTFNAVRCLTQSLPAFPLADCACDALERWLHRRFLPL